MIGNFGAASKLFLVAENIQPSAVWLYVNRSAYYSLLKEYDRALELTDKAIEADNRCPIAYSNKAAVQLSLGMFDSAVKNASLALSLCKFYDMHARQCALANRAEAFVGLDKIEEAKQDVAALFRLNKKAFSGFVVLGKIDIKSGDSHKAIENFNQALAFAEAINKP
ncbi:MAG: hypothetical protein SGJ27_03005 [Candidatus Melainabacteria bacterium]|nr:hypothetical protein [Candidatus Melainabacteria bacterium]